MAKPHKTSLSPPADTHFRGVAKSRPAFKEAASGALAVI
jgi:hypothetical protein